MRIQYFFIGFWVSMSASTIIVVAIRGHQYWRRRNREKVERMFVELRSQGYNICDVNSNATRAKLSYMDPFEEKYVWRWVDIVELGGGYGLADPINSERN